MLSTYLKCRSHLLVFGTAWLTWSVAFVVDLEHSVVKFTGAAFKNAYNYFNVVENMETIQRYAIFLAVEAERSVYFKVGNYHFGRCNYLYYWLDF